MSGAECRKIYIATIIDTYNYGTVLQAVATQDLILPYGDPLFVDYRRPEFSDRGRAKEIAEGEQSRLRKIVKLLKWYPTRVKMTRVFRGFVRRYLPLCPAEPFLNEGEFGESAVYCVGSDQTWNSVFNRGISPLYFLANVPDAYKKISLSASFGRANLDEWEVAETARLLHRFDAISVRESSSLAILRSLGIEGVALKDPALLCNPELWERMAAPVALNQSEYVLVYMLTPDGRLLDYARRVARERGVGLVSIAFNPFKKTSQGVTSVCLPTPERWLALFRDASYVVTDSFHGTCFSLIFEKPFTSFDPPRFSVRISDVLADFGLSGREVPVGAPVEGIRAHELPIDWDSVRLLRARFRAEGRAFLNECLG